MTAGSYEIRLCYNCGLRYPLIEGHPFGTRCPVCLGETKIVLKRSISPLPMGEGPRVRENLSALLDNIRSALNVGAIFRTADGLGIRNLYLCGITPTPDNEAVRKTSLGAEESVAWEYSRNALETAVGLKNKGHPLIALEQDDRATSLLEFSIPKYQSLVPVLIVGNEVTGTDPELLDICNQIVHIPMLGSKHSLNVEVAFGITAFHLTSRLNHE